MRIHRPGDPVSIDPVSIDHPGDDPARGDRGRRGIPLLASLVPLVGALVLWWATGSALALLFALLGPLVAAASGLDGLRARRRQRRRAATERELAGARARSEVAGRHAEELVALDRAHPDVAGFLERREEIWRAGRGRELTLGRGEAASAIRVAGDIDGAIRAHAAVLPRAPQPVGLAGGVCVIAPASVGLGVARALVLQACLAFPPSGLEVIGAPPGERAWLDALPHRMGGPPGRFRLAYVGDGEGVPGSCDGVIAVVEPGAPPPPDCAAHIVVTAPGRGRVAADGPEREVAVEGVSRAQALTVAQELSARARRLAPPPPPVRDVSFAALRQPAGALRAALGSFTEGTFTEGAPSGGAGAEEVVTVDLVADGPHAIVVGTTGTGKSELLITWVAALATGRAPHEVSFLLADFKGGTAFDGLRDLPHVVGVITDLDGGGATRAIESLRAEMRRREEALTNAGVRDIAEAPAGLGRLVVVVDEFAALLADHPELQRVFVDVAARGRALGVHLIVGTQRAQGVVRDALLTNCPLRICLRVGDQGESRMLVGDDSAAALPGGVGGRGQAVVRRAGDTRPMRWRVALTSPEDIRAIGGVTTGAPHPVWLPPLPDRIDEDRLGERVPGVVRLGVVDEPDRQRRSVLAARPGSDRGVLVLGGPGAGKSTALERIAADGSGPVVRIGTDLEQAWDAVHALERGVPAGAVVLVDDLDVLASAYPAEYAAAFLDALERAVRGCRDAGALPAISARRATGAWARISDLLPLRVLLAMPSRVDHLAAGGDPARFDPAAPPGRGSVGARAVQIAWAPAAPDAPPAPLEPWRAAGAAGVVTRTAAATADRLARAFPRAEVVLLARAAGVDRVDPGDGERPTVYVGDPDQWQRQWSLLAELRGSHELVVAAECAAQVRVLLGTAELPPYAAIGRGRAWLSDRGGSLRRVGLPG